MTVPLEEHS